MRQRSDRTREFLKSLSGLEILADGKPHSGPEILDEIEKKASELKFDERDIQAFRKNPSYYFKRGIEEDILARGSEGGGPHSGYRLVQENTSSESQYTVQDDATPRSVNDNSFGKREQREALLHFPITIALLDYFQTSSPVVRSLASHIGCREYNNPDLLMVRDCDTNRDLVERGIDSEWVNCVDDSPKAILTSVELKYFQSWQRKNVIQALAEACANSQWANETALVFYCPKGSNFTSDPDISTIAKTMGVGVYELRVVNKGTCQLSPWVLVEPRRSLRLRSIGVKMVEKAQEAVEEWKIGSKGTDDQLPDYISFLLTAVNNLTTQRGCGCNVDDKCLSTTITNLSQDSMSDIGDVIYATLMMAVRDADLKNIESNSTALEIIDAIKESVRSTGDLRTRHRDMICGVLDAIRCLY